MSRMWAAAAARIAVDLGDSTVAARAERLIGPVDTPRSEVYVHTVAWAAAVLAGDLDGAAREARAAVASTERITDRVAVLADLAATFAALRGWDDAGATLDELETAVATLTEPAPGPRARGAVVRARLLLAADQLAAADASAHRALSTAADAGLRLVQIDAVETIAVVALAAGDHASAAGLLATTTAERQQRGYLGRLTTPATKDLVERLAAGQPVAGTVSVSTPEPCPRRP